MASFNLDKAIKQWLRLFRKHRAFNHGSIREMELHLRDHIDDLIANGKTEENAFNEAVKNFGEITPIAKEEFWNLRPKTSLHTLYNTAMFHNYLKITIRNFWKQKFYSFINIIGLTMGLSIVFIIGLYVSDELSFDQFHAKKHQLYRVVENQYYADQPVFPVAVTPTALGPSLIEEFPEIVNFTRVNRESFRFEMEGNKVVEDQGLMVEANFFEMFSFPLTEGDLQSFADNPRALILNEELAAKYFPNQNPIGAQLILNDEEFVVTGVVQNVPNNSHINFRYFTNFKYYLSQDPENAAKWGSNWLYTYVELKPEADMLAVNSKIMGQIKAHHKGSVTDIYLQPLDDIYLGTVDFVVEVTRKGQMIYIKVFALVAVFILLISCINFMNLSTARSAKRSKEVGLRKTVGANRTQLVIQFLSESVLFTIVAVILAILLVALMLPTFNQLANKEFEMNILLDPAYGIKFSLIILSIALITGLIAGSYPALVLSATKPIKSLSGKAEKGNAGAILRRILVIIQFAISVILIIGTVVVYQQLNYIQNVDLGYNKDNIIYTFAPSDKVRLFASELREQQGVVKVGLSNRHPAYVMSSSSGFSWSGANPDETVLIHFMGVDEHYLKTMEMNIVDGRDFTEIDSAAVIINETALALMGIDDPIGQTIEAYGEQKIVGVVKDFNFKSIHNTVEPIIVFKLSNPNRVFIKYNPAEEANIVTTLKSSWDKVFPDREIDYYFLKDDFNELYQAEQRTSMLSSIFAGLAILISCLGLFGLVSYATEQRTKEVGIRKVLGASINTLFLLLTADFTKLVLLSLLISIPIGWWAMSKWLEGFAYRIDISFWVFVVSGAVALLIAVLTVSYQTIKAAVGNPVNALRNE